MSYDWKKISKIEHDDTKHYPNKDEATLLRQIISSEGLTEEEVRSHKKYRKMLSEAQKRGREAKRDERTKFYQNLIKKACQKTGLVPQHPETLKVLGELFIAAKNRSRSYYNPWLIRENFSAETIVRKFAK